MSAVRKIGKGWWVTGKAGGESWTLGPWNTQQEAKDCKRGLLEFLKHEDDGEWFLGKGNNEQE